MADIRDNEDILAQNLAGAGVQSSIQPQLSVPFSLQESGVSKTLQPQELDDILSKFNTRHGLKVEPKDITKHRAAAHQYNPYNPSTIQGTPIAVDHSLRKDLARHLIQSKGGVRGQMLHPAVQVPSSILQPLGSTFQSRYLYDPEQSDLKNYSKSIQASLQLNAPSLYNEQSTIREQLKPGIASTNRRQDQRGHGIGAAKTLQLAVQPQVQSTYIKKKEEQLKKNPDLKDNTNINSQALQGVGSAQGLKLFGARTPTALAQGGTNALLQYLFTKMLTDKARRKGRDQQFREQVKNYLLNSDSFNPPTDQVPNPPN